MKKLKLILKILFFIAILIVFIGALFFGPTWIVISLGVFYFVKEIISMTKQEIAANKKKEDK